MKLLEACEIVGETSVAEGKPFHLSLVCGFNPLHLRTFLGAELRRRRPDRKTELETGLYGDFWGNLERAGDVERDAIAVVLEWPDLDPRLGIRNLGGWNPPLLPVIVEAVGHKADRLVNEVQRLAKQSPVAITPPTLPLPPAAFTPGWRASAFELDLRSTVAYMMARLSSMPNIRILSQSRLDELSPFAERGDVRAEVMSGFPYQVKHASILAELFSLLLAEATPKKGLITDLDDTLWRGIVGEVGAEGITWDLDHRSHMHGLYQQFLASLSAAGVLIGVASKNDPGVVAEAFRRGDLLIPQESIFPLEVHWNSKSESIARILKAWNIGANAVVFVDDSPAELAEVQAVHPEIEAISFPTKDPQSIFDLLRRLRDLLGKDTIGDEDALRLQSIRHSYERAGAGAASGGSPDSFLEQAEAVLSVNHAIHEDPRAFELLNKTNQFNLNGRRLTFVEWKKCALGPENFSLAVSYRDKYGPLGKIAVLAGRLSNGTLFLDNWVMSCRALGRRIEYTCMAVLFQRYRVSEIEFNFMATDLNGPLQSFLVEVLGVPPFNGIRLSNDQFQARRLKAFHTVTEIINNDNND